jgi:predicted ATPase
MRIHRLTLRNYRAISEYRLDLPESGVVVIEGENEVGKSSIAEALWVVFHVPDSSDSERIRAIKPVDRDAATEIEIEVSTGEYRFVYFKRYHRSPRTELRMQAPGPEHLTGREAHDRALAILKETMDTTLWSALRLLQGESLNEVPLAGHASLAAALDEAAAAHLGGDREESLMERVHREYRLYFTETGRENRDFAAIRAAAEEAEERVRNIEKRIEALDALAERHAELESECARLGAAAAAAAAATIEARTSAAGRERLVATVANLETRARLARSERDTALAEIERRQRAEQSLAAARERLALLEPQRANTAGELARAEHGQARAKKEAEAAEEEYRRQTANARVAGDDYAYHHERLQVEQMAERVERVQRNQAELRELAGRLNAIAVNARVVAGLEALDREYQQAASRAGAEGASVEVNVESPATISIDGESAYIEPGTPFEARVAGETVFALPGGIEVRVRAGHQAAQAAAAASEARAHLEAALTAAGVASVVEARELESERRALIERRTGLERQVEADLRDQTAESLAAKLDRSRAWVDGYEASRHAGVPLPATLQEAREARDAAAAAEAHAATAHEAAREALRLATERLSELKAGMERLDHQAEAAAREVAGLAASLDEAAAREPAEELSARAAEAAATLDSINHELERARRSLDELGDATARLAAAEAAQGKAGQALQEAERERSETRGALQHAGESGLHQQLQDARSARDAAASELASWEARANAARTLHDTLKRHRDAARRAYAAPLQDRVQEFGRAVFGPTFAIELDTELRIARRTLNGVTLEFQRLSVGTREQLGILLRLAVASLVSKSGGVPLVLDDALGWSDPRRLQRLGDVLALAARETQVVVLTCTPERFASVAPATVISLPSGAVRRQEAAPAPDPGGPAPGSAPRRAPPARQPAGQAAFDLFGEPVPPPRR